ASDRMRPLSTRRTGGRCRTASPDRALRRPAGTAPVRRSRRRGTRRRRSWHAGHLVADAVDHVARGGLGRLGEDERELVAPDAECVVSLAYRLLDRACEHLQGIVAAGVTEPVVDALEAVEVAHDQRELAVVAARA